MNVANCRGQIDPSPGDINNQEWRIQGWWDFPWDVVLRHPDENVAHLINNYARHAANNERCGYSQSNRLSFWHYLEQAKDYDPANILTVCDADCSSSTAAIVKAVGYKLGDERLKSVSEALTTFYMEPALEGVGFTPMYSYAHSESALKPGDILLNINAHVVIAVADTDLATSSSEPIELHTGDRVRISQTAKMTDGNTIPYWASCCDWIVGNFDDTNAMLTQTADGHFAMLTPVKKTDLIHASDTQTIEAEEADLYDEDATQYYTVKSGDCLYTIAERYLGDGNRYPEIQALNNIENPNLIHPGQMLQLPN